MEKQSAIPFRDLGDQSVVLVRFVRNEFGDEEVFIGTNNKANATNYS